MRKGFTMANIQNTGNFPEFLFFDRPDIVTAAKSAVLSAEEMEVFGYTYHISRVNASNEGSGGPKRWPLDYAMLKDHGGYFATMHLLAGIESKIGAYSNISRSKREMANLAKDVYNFGLYMPGKAFSFCNMPKDFIASGVKNLPNLEGKKVDITYLYDKCKAVEEPVFVGSSEKSNTKDDAMPQIIRAMITRKGAYSQHDASYELGVDETTGKCIALEKVERWDEEYTRAKQQYLRDKSAYDRHPDMYEEEPVFKCEYEYWLRLTELGEQYIAWMEN